MISGKDDVSQADHRSGTKYSAVFRESALTAIDQRLGEGQSLTSVAREMQLPLHTIRRWVAARRAAFRPVEISSSPSTAPASGLIVATVHGTRIEGLDLPALLAVLRVLESHA